MAWDCYCNSKFSFPGPRTKLLPTVWYDSLQSHPMLLCLLVRLEVPQNWAGICCCFHTKFSALLILCGSNCDFFCATTTTGNFLIGKKNFKHSVPFKDKLITIQSSFWTQMGNIWSSLSLYTLSPPTTCSTWKKKLENLIPTWGVFP